MNSETVEEVRRSLGVLIALGILMILLGLAALLNPLLVSIAVARILSWIFLFAGIVRTVYAIQAWRQRGFWLKLIVGILYLVVAILLLSNAFGATLTLTLALGWVIVAQGILEIITAFKVRPEPNWGWMLFSGLMALILGILILNRWPFNAIWLLGFFTGLSFIVAGFWMIMLPQAVSRHLTRN
jgi:uncharacterized membrane protein HdeD (DUF308 family)